MWKSLLLAPTLPELHEAPRAGLKRAATMGMRAVQLSATQPGMRPRELDESARRDLRATLRRLELICAGIDLWIPPDHFVKSEHQDRAIAAAFDALVFAQQMEHCPVSMHLPRFPDPSSDGSSIVESIVSEAARLDVPIADHALPWNDHAQVGLGIDPAALLSQDHDPAADIASLGTRITSARLVDLSTAGMRCPIGRTDGRLDVQSYCIGLSVAGYARPLIVDMRQWTNPIEGLRSTVERLDGSTSSTPYT